MKTKVHRSLAWLLSACMIVMLFPMSALAVNSSAPTAAVLSNGNTTLTVTLAGAPASSDTITVYDAAEAGTTLKTFTIADTNTTQTITLASAATGEVYVTYTASGDTESARVTSTGYMAPYTLSIGNETSNSGVGRSRTITVGGSQKDNLSGKYLVVAITEGSGDTAKVSVVMFELTKSPANISYQTAGASVEAWLVNTSDMPSFTGEAITGDFVAHDQAN